MNPLFLNMLLLKYGNISKQIRMITVFDFNITDYYWKPILIDFSAYWNVGVEKLDL